MGAGLAALVQEYATRTGATGPGQVMLLGGERALLLTRPPGGGAVVLAVHAGRVYVVSTRGAHRDDPSPAPDFQSFLAGFRFVDPAAFVDPIASASP